MGSTLSSTQGGGLSAYPQRGAGVLCYPVRLLQAVRQEDTPVPVLDCRLLRPRVPKAGLQEPQGELQPLCQQGGKAVSRSMIPMLVARMYVCMLSLPAGTGAPRAKYSLLSVWTAPVAGSAHSFISSCILPSHIFCSAWSTISGYDVSSTHLRITFLRCNCIWSVQKIERTALAAI